MSSVDLHFDSMMKLIKGILVLSSFMTWINMRRHFLSEDLLWASVLLSSSLSVSWLFYHNEQISVRIAAAFHPVIKSGFLSVDVYPKGFVRHLKSHSAVLFISLGRGAVHVSSLTPHVFWSSLLIPACLGRCDANAVLLICMLKEDGGTRGSNSACVNCVAFYGCIFLVSLKLRVALTHKSHPITNVLFFFQISPLIFLL